MQSTDDRQFESNASYQDGRQTELVFIRFLEKHGFIVRGAKSNQQYYDIILIDPTTDIEYIGQVKSSKSHTPYIRCASEQGLIELAEQMQMIPIIILSYTLDRKFTIINAIDKTIMLSNRDDHVKGETLDFRCWRKDR